jgi:hypothetical protein
MDSAPVIIPYTSNQQSRILSIFISSNQKRNSFYVNSLIPNVPSFMVLPVQIPNTSIFFVKDNLIVKGVNPSDIEPISPYIGNLLVKSYFKSRFIKTYPSVKVMGRQEYLDYRISQYNESITKLNNYIQALEDEISGYYGRIQSDKTKIANNQSIISESASSRDSYYNSCVSAGYYFYGYYYHYYSQSYCDNQRTQWDAIINKANQNISDLSSDISTTQSYLYQDQEADKEAKSYVSYIESAKDQTPQELGVFEPDNNIKVAVDETSPNVVVDYFETLAHEYLHYSSYVDKDKTFTYNFFEEGLTEYFARKVATNEFNVNTHMGYPLLVAVMKEIIKKIPESTLEDIYFKKDESTLEAVLANAYGENFYKDTENYFSILPYLSGTKDGLKIANAIMLRIGGRTLTENDLYSSRDTTN